MNRITLFAQLLGALVFCIAASAIADPGQGEIKRIKQSPGDEAGTLKGRLKWGDIVLKANAIRPEGGKVLRESSTTGKIAPVQFAMLLDWTDVFAVGRSMEAFNNALKGNYPSGPGVLELGARRVDFTSGLITEVKFPALDGASKEPAYITVKMSAELQPATGGGTPIRLSRSSAPPDSGKQKSWLPSNFRLKIDGLNASRVKHFPTVTLKPEAARGTQRRGGETVLGDMVMPEADFKAANWVKWTGPEFDASKNEFRPARTGRLFFMDDSDGKEALTLRFRVVGLGRIKSLPGGDVQVGLRMDQFQLARG